LGDPETFTITVHPAPTPSGTDFWFVAPEVTTYPGHELPAFLAISNGTYQTANVTITRYNGANPSIVNTEAIAPGTLYKLDLTSAADMSTMANPRGLAGSVTEFGTHITSDVKVTAYYMHNATGSRDIFTLKGRQAFGTLFYVPMQSDNAAPTGATFTNAIDQVDIVATEDSTTVTVTPTTVIRIGASGSSPADTPITRTLNKGETLKIMENVINGVPLAGTKIVADQPVAVTVSEDMIGGGDLAGDQIVPVASLGTRYIVPRGYLTNTTTRPERFYLLGAYADTEVKVYADINNPNSFTTISLNVGTSARYNFPANVYAVYVEATQPVYLYHFSGYGEDGAALIPSVYAIGQTQVNFFQVAVSEVQKGFLLFRTGTENSFTISYGSVVDAPLPLTPIAVPKESEWKVARFDLPASPTAGQVMTIKSSASSFVFGYITGNITNNDSYGYFSDFGTFEFPDTTYMCENSVTLQGGYALSHLWTYPNGVTTSTATSITVTQEGLYTLEMNQDPNIVVATTYVKKINAGTVSPASQFVCEGNQPATLTVAGASDVVVAPFQWQSSTDNLTWTNINGATAATYNPGILNAPSGVTESIYYRRGATSNYCGTVYSNAAEVKVSPCAVIVNPHLRTGVNY
jgi:hypothetical protein